MKFNFKKIASVLATTVMLGSTIAFATAAWPSPFVSGGAANGAIVVGSAAANSDMVAATNLKDSLNTGVTVISTSGSVTGEAKAIETSGQKLYLGDYMNTTKSVLTSSDLPTVLADGKVTDTDGTSFDYNLKINVPNARTKYDKTVDNLAAPIVYVDFGSSSQSYSQDIVFPTSVNMTKLADKDITIFGKKFTFSGNSADLTTTKLVLYESSNTKLIKSGESAIVSVGGTDYTIKIEAVEDATHALISVNGVSQSVTETQSYKVAGLDLYVKNVIGANVAGEQRAVEITAGSAKLTLENGNDVTKGSDTVYGARTTISASGGKISKISIAVTPYSLDERVRYLKIGDSFADPVFGAFKISAVSYTPAADDISKDLIEMKSTGENKASLKWTNKAGGAYEMDMFKPSTVCVNSIGKSNTTFACNDTFAYNASALGYDTYDIIATTTGHVNENDYFITNHNEYSQIFRVDRIDVNNKKVKLRDQASGATAQEISLNDSMIGAVATLTLADGSTATVTLNGNVSGAENVTVGSASPILYTKGGAKIDLTKLSDPVLNNQSSSNISLTEETSYNDGDFKNNLAATLGSTMSTLLLWKSGQSGNDMKFGTPVVGGLVSGDSGSTVGDYDKYFLDTYGTFVKMASNSNSDNIIDIYYPGTAANLGVYIAEQAAITGAEASKIMVVTDSEVSSVSAKNLIVVGGSCINTVAATLLGSTTPLCGADFSAKTNADAGKFLIQTFASPYNSAKIAMLVAGYDAADTTAAVAQVKLGGESTEVGSKTVYPISST